jgi:hypothetical protein
MNELTGLLIAADKLSNATLNKNEYPVFDTDEVNPQIFWE